MKNLTLSIARMIDCAIVGRYLGADGLSAMKLAMPVFSILGLFSSILSTGLSISAARDLARGDQRLREVSHLQGIVTVNLILPSLQDTAMLPPCFSATAFAMERPRP